MSLKEVTMKLAIIGSRTLSGICLEKYLPAGVTEIVSGGAKGVDRLAASYAKEHRIPLTEFLPDYQSYGSAAPLVRNRRIAEYADEALVFWDGVSHGTRYTAEQFRKQGKKVLLILGDGTPSSTESEKESESGLLGGR
jgi:predicted Rossmann fold nucleotide-binding protein DprA/Smf involved in DNA uptake